MSTLQTTPTSYVTASDGVRFAYRCLGTSTGVPLVLHIHFRANMDFWDPLLINSLAATRPVLIFDQAGVGRSTGEVATTFQGWAENVIVLCQALKLDKIDLLGFSMGGCTVQMVALTEPDLVRKLIIAGSTASVSVYDEDGKGIVWPRDQPPTEPITVLANPHAKTVDEAEHAIAFSFFYDTEAGHAAAKAYWDRVKTRDVPDEPKLLTLLSAEGSARQSQSFADWSTANLRNSFQRLGELKMPVLVLNGDDDLLIPTSRSWELLTRIDNAGLYIYPKAGHGFIWQYAELVAEHINSFLDREGDILGAAKL